jgi:hypothetical protein
MGAVAPNRTRYNPPCNKLFRRTHAARKRRAVSQPAQPTFPGATRCCAPHPNCQTAEHARQDSNLQPPVLETGALPIELRAYTSGQGQNRTADTMIFSHVLYQLSYLALHIGPLVPTKNPRCVGGGAGGHEVGAAVQLSQITPARRSRQGVDIAAAATDSGASSTRIRRSRHGLSVSAFHIAGAGFEPATSGL